MHLQYNVEEWAARTSLGRRVFNYNYRMFGRELRGREMLKEVTMQEGPGVAENVYLWQGQRDQGEDLVRIGVAELDNWRSAQERLLQELTQSMRPEIPRGTGKLAKLGDVSFVARDPKSDIPAAISFTRGNVCVSVRSVGEKDVDVSDVAATLDRTLSEPPTKAALERGLARKRTPVAVDLKADEAYVLLENLPKAAPRGEWLKVIAPDGELGRTGDALVFVSPQGGKKRIATFAVKST
jgi:hypothetical protein